MKVKCIRLFDSTGNEVDTSKSLVLDRIYHVIGIHIDPIGETKYQIVTDDRVSPVLATSFHSAKCFEIASSLVPSNWCVRILKSKSIGIAPKSFEAGFLERLFDADPEAVRIFEAERIRIVFEDP